MKVVLIILGSIVVVLLIGIFAATRGMKEIRNLTIDPPDVSKIPDGVYEGRYAVTRWKYGVRVTVKDGALADIEVTEKPDAADVCLKAAEAMVDGQTVRIDTVSGASINTKAFQKAVENALRTAL